MIRLECFLIIGITLFQYGCGNPAPSTHANISQPAVVSRTDESIDTRSLEERNYWHYHPFPSEVSSIAELRNISPVNISADEQWCALVWFSPYEGVGYGRAIVYKRNNSNWQKYWESSYILLPEIQLLNGEIIITKKRGLNNDMRDEVFRTPGH